MLYTILKFIHVLAMAVWLGGLVAMLTLNRILTATGDSALIRGFSRVGAALSMRLYMPAMLITLVTGIGMVQVAEIGFGTKWIVWGIVGLIGSFILGGVLTGGTARKLGQKLAKGEIDAAGAAAVQRRILTYAILNVLLLSSIVWAMVAKPS